MVVRRAMPGRTGAIPDEDPGAGRLMAVLDNGISAADLEARLSAWLDEGVIDQLTAAAARRLNAQLWEASRWEGLLRVLYATATDLTGIRDIEAPSDDAGVGSTMKRTRDTMVAP